MMSLRAMGFCLAIGGAAAVSFPTAAAQDKGVGQPTADARELYEFVGRVRTYVELHRKLEDQLPKLSDESDAATLRAHQRALGDKIRAARASAKVGDLFTLGTRHALRRILGRVVGPAERAAITDPDDNPASFKPKVNGSYPASLPASTMPPTVLVNLPSLPDEVEFRFVGKYLILRDTHADVIVDFIADAIR